MEATLEKTIQVLNPNAGGMFNIAFDLLRKDSEKQLDLLDAGCGKGQITERLRQMGYQTTGIDISEEDIQSAKSTFLENSFFQHDLNETLPFKDNSFDIILSNSVFQYIDWRKVIKEYRRVLRPNGQALFIENLRGNPLAKVYRVIKRGTGSYKKHYVPLEHMDFKDLTYFNENFTRVTFKFCVLFSTLVIVIPGTPKFGFRTLKLSVRAFLVKMENKLLVKFPSLSKYCSKVIITGINQK